MKFGKQLRLLMKDEWADNYVRYKEYKKLLKIKGGSDDDRMRHCLKVFFCALASDLPPAFRRFVQHPIPFWVGYWLVIGAPRTDDWYLTARDGCANPSHVESNITHWPSPALSQSHPWAAKTAASQSCGRGWAASPSHPNPCRGSRGEKGVCRRSRAAGQIFWRRPTRCCSSMFVGALQSVCG